MIWQQPVSINGWTDKETAVYKHTGMLFSLKKEENLVICYNIDEPGREYAKWNMPGTDKYCLILLICAN